MTNTNRRRVLGVLAAGSARAAAAPRAALAQQAALEDPQVREQYAQQGVALLPLGTETFRKYCDAEAVRWADVIGTAGLELD